MESKPVCVSDFEAYAEKILPKGTYEYYKDGACHGSTILDNMKSFQRWKIRPRVLRDITRRDISTTILGHKIAFPVCVSPTAMHGLAHWDAEAATARGTQAAGVGFTVSLNSTQTIEEVAKSSPHALRFQQLYIMKNKDLTLKHVRSAERHGYKALVLTVDSPVFAHRWAERRNQFLDRLPPDFIMGNFATLQLHGASQSSARPSNVKNDHNQGFTWADMKWLLSVTRLPVIAKGILSGEDAKIAIDCGISGIMVSNHGGRQLDTVMSTIDALPEVVDAVNGRCEVYMDGGVRNGTDIFKALALGAKAVFVGRPVVYALAYDGDKGVAQMLEILKDEFSTTMALAGCASVEDIKREMVVHKPFYQSQL